MKFLKKSILIKCVVGLIVVVVAKDFIFGWAVSKALSSVLGTKVTLSSAHLGILTSSVRLKNLKISQPHGFGNGRLLQAPLIEASVNPLSLISGKPHIRKLTINIQSVEIVHGKDGALNVDELKVVKNSKKEQPKKTDAKLQWKIDVLNLSIYRIASIDLRGEKPSVETHELNIRDAHYENIESAEALVSLILVQSLQSAAIKSAAIYGAATVLGVSVLPVTAAFILAGNSESSTIWKSGVGGAYAAALKAVKELGTDIEENKSSHQITAQIGGTKTEVSVAAEGWGKSRVTVSSKQMFLPKPKIAAGVVYWMERQR